MPDSVRSIAELGRRMPGVAVRSEEGWRAGWARLADPLDAVSLGHSRKSRDRQCRPRRS